MDMSASTPPPIPSGQPPSRPAAGPASDPGYNFMADKIGGVPNLRKKDNLYQAVAIGLFLIIGVIVGWFVGGGLQGALLGGLAGLIAGTLISGVVLMVIGFLRKS